MIVYLVSVKNLFKAALKLGIKPGQTMIAIDQEPEHRDTLESLDINVITLRAKNKLAEDINTIIKQLKQLGPKTVMAMAEGDAYLTTTLLLASLLYRELYDKDVSLTFVVNDSVINLDFVKIGPSALKALCYIKFRTTRRSEFVNIAEKELGIKKPTIYKLLERMEENKFIVIERGGIIRLTDIGETIATTACVQ